MTGPFDQTPSGVLFCEMRVTRVNESDHTVDLQGDGPNATYAVGVPWGSPLSHADGGGIESLPRVGTTVWAVWHETDDLPLILTCSSPPVPGEGYGNNRIGVKQGESVIWTHAGNLIHMLSNGNILLHAGEDCRRIFIPVTRLIEDLCKDYRLITEGGELQWITSEDEEGRCIFSIEARRYTGEDPSLSMLLGDVKSEKLGSLLCLVTGTDFTFAVDHDGNITYETASLTHTISNDVTIEVGGDMSLHVKGDEQVTVDGSLRISCGQSHTFSAQYSEESLQTYKKIEAPKIFLGTSATHPSILGDLLIQALITHTHPVPGGPPDPSLAAQLINALSSSVLVSK